MKKTEFLYRNNDQDEDHFSFAKSTEWKDVVPIPQDDGPDPICPIVYRPDFVEAMNYFRAIVKANEKSQRALKCTTAVIHGNPANYTAWLFRRQCLFALGSDLHAEMRWVESMARESPKNYQLWHHRRAVIEVLNVPLDDLKVTAEILARDSKNYHVWAHRQWLLKRFSLWERELHFVESLLKADVRNNSAWNQRHFVISETTGYTRDIISREMAFSAEHIRLAPHNESPWNYVDGLMKKPAFDHFADLHSLCQQTIKQDVSCPFSYALQVELFERFPSAETYSVSARAVDELIERADVVRRKYWQFRRTNQQVRWKALQQPTEKQSSKSPAEIPTPWPTSDGVPNKVAPERIAASTSVSAPVKTTEILTTTTTTNASSVTTSCSTSSSTG